MGFRLDDHMNRLIDSTRIYKMPFKYTVEELVKACVDTVRENGLKNAYVRPLAYYGYRSLGVIPEEDTPVDLIMAAFEWGSYLGEEGLSKGVDVCVSSWNRVGANTIPAAAKASGNYLSSYLIGSEAKSRGYHEGLALGTDGKLSEGAGENVFVIRGGKIITPPASASIMLGITRDTVFKFCHDMGIEIEEQTISRELLYIADEVFLSGTAAEITPVRSIDDITMKMETPGPITRKISDAFFGLFKGNTPDKHGWLTPIY
jgi:branched-chain amino acid aminotransferase